MAAEVEEVHARNDLRNGGRARRSSRRGSDAADLGPYVKGLCPEGSIPGGRNVAAAEMEEIVDLVVGEEEALCLAGQLEPLHLPFSSARGLMRVLRPVVEAFVLSVLDTGHDLALRGGVAGELISDHDARRPALPLQQLP